MDPKPKIDFYLQPRANKNTYLYRSISGISYDKIFSTHNFYIYYPISMNIIDLFDLAAIILPFYNWMIAWNRIYEAIEVNQSRHYKFFSFRI